MRQSNSVLAMSVAAACAMLFALQGCQRDSQAGDRRDGQRRHGMDFSTMQFPVAKADFLSKMNDHMRQRCANPNRAEEEDQGRHRGSDCSTLEAAIAKCTASADVPASIADEDAAHSAARGYFRCLRGDD